MPPGLVSEMLVPWKSSGLSLLSRVFDQLLVIGVEAGEVEAVGTLDRWDHQAVGAVLALDVDGDAEVDRATLDRERFALALLEGADHDREVLGGADDRPGDEVGEGDLHPPLFENPVQSLALGVQRVDGHRPERSGGGNRPALVHRRGQHRRRPPDRLGLAGRGWGRARSAVRSSKHVLFGHLRPGPLPRSRTSGRPRAQQQRDAPPGSPELRRHRC